MIPKSICSTSDHGVDTENSGPCTAAHDALDSDDQTIAPYFLRELVPLMSNLHRPTKAGMTPLHLAVIKKNMPALKVIMATTPDINARAHGGVTPLHLAYGLQEPVLIDYLLSWNADPELRNDNHLTPYSFGSICKRDPNTLDKYLADIYIIESEGLGNEAFGPVIDHKVLAAELLERSQYVPDDRFTRDASDPSQGMTKVEEVHLVMFELSLAKNGERHYDTLWRMNNLGCVYERYGRLSRAEVIYRNGWNIARDVLGNGHILTADFANKLGRVQEDIGRARSDDDLSAWMARFKKDTLNRSLVEYRSPADEEGLACLFSPPKEAVEGVCDRAHCKRPAAITCPDQYARYLTNHIFSKLTHKFIDSDFGDHLPTVASARLLLCNPKTFQQPLRLRTKSNTVVLFLSNGGFKYMIKATDSQWKMPKGFEMMLLYDGIDLWVAPDPSTWEHASENTPSVAALYATEEHGQMLLLAEYIHLDFPKAMERRTQRLAAEERKSH
ncbi:hypothetical protein F5883DRAFT_619854 [Diaporthe sp. PMI_573]|nr:hypothetical protein F5883DRAFT_619854 [Diaporthaceae sp. PMI_573]